MRELTIRLRFKKESIGNVKAKDRSGYFLLPRNPQRYVVFLATWHKLNMRFASQLLGRHQGEVEKIHWDIQVDGALRSQPYRRYYSANGKGKSRFALHEMFAAGQEIGINCVVPSAIADDDFWRLMQIAGQYKGLSPWKPGEFGLFEVVRLLPRRPCNDGEQEERATAQVRTQQPLVNQRSL